MEMAECKNKRSANFTSTEETRLVELVKKYKHILECKVSDTKTNQKKTECWDTIVKEFNGTVGQTYRHQNVLRKKYENIKKRVKRKFAEEKTYMRGTGGGPPKVAKFTDLDSEVRELLGARIEGFPSQFSDDAEVNGVDGPSCSQEPAHIKIKTPMMHISPATIKNKLGTGPSWGFELLKEAVSEVPYNPDLIPVENVELEYIDASEGDCIEQSTNVFPETADLENEAEELVKDSGNEVTDWSKYTPKMLKEKKSSALQIRKNGSTAKNNNATVNKVCQWATIKAAVEESRKTIMEKEHALKMKHMQEKHEMELQLMKLKSSVEIKHMEEVHAENMRILKSKHDV